MKPVTHFYQLNQPEYRRLAEVAARNLGWHGKGSAYSWLTTSALETSEEGVIDEVNFCLDLL